MMKRILCLLAALLVLLPASVNAATINAASCSYNDVQAAIQSAASGDTVLVPAGNCTWNSSLKITKGIILLGAGIGNTIITNRGACDLGFQGEFWLQYEPSNYDLNTPFRLSGFTFDLNNECSAFALGQPAKRAPFTVQTKIRIDHNRWINTIHYFIWNAGGMYGVVDNNIFEGSDYTFKNDPQASESAGWYANSPQNIFVSGTNNYLYYEDNTVTTSSESANGAAECQYSGRYAYRYNTIISPQPSYSLFEMHGHQTSGSMPSCFGAEVYGNRVIAGSNHICLFKVRGGRSFIFYNSITSGYLENVAYSGSLVTCPASYATEQMIHDTYWWNNRKDFTGSFAAANIDGSVTCDGRSDIPLAGRDVVADNTSPGVGCGTLANLPLTCTVNEGYWATDQSCSDLTGRVGSNPASPISGTLYKCTSPDSWTAFYTPYTYPHPFRTDCTNYPGLCDSGAEETCNQYGRINSTTVQACSCNQTDVQATVNAASDGDTVIVPEGNCSWLNTIACGYENTADTALCIKKTINLQGSGVDKTIIKRSGTIVIWAPNPSETLNLESLNINGFTFDGNGNSVPGMIRLISPSNEIVYVTIGHNKFKDSLASAVAVRGSVDGVVYSNEFIDIAIINGIFGDDGGSWASLTREYGTGNNLYFEDNTISFSKSTNHDPGWTESGQGGRVAMRYNLWDSTNTISGEYWDVHGLQSCPGRGLSTPSCEQYSTMVAEYYGNMIIMTGAYRWILHRGSWLMMFNNYVTGGTTSPGISIGQYSCDQCAYGQEGYVQHVANTYTWNNIIRGTRVDMYVGADYCNDGSCGNFPNYTITQDRDFFNYDASCTATSCSHGIGCGATAPNGACSPGVGYWVTSATPCNTSPSTMQDLKTYTQSGKFYKCTTLNTWTEYYKPYIYPHPLTIAPFGTDICSEGQITSSCWCEGMKSNGYCCHGYYQAASCDSGSGCVLPADINCDDVVNLVDLKLVAQDFSKTSGLNNAKSDTNNNGVVDIFDVVFVASRFT